MITITRINEYDLLINLVLHLSTFGKHNDFVFYQVVTALLEAGVTEADAVETLPK